MSPHLRSIALTRWDVIFNCVTGKMKFPPSAANGVDQPSPRAFGYIRDLAARIVAGEVGHGQTFKEIADEHEIDVDSLRCAVWRAKKTVRAKRRAAA